MMRPHAEISVQEIPRLIAALDSLQDGGLAAETLIGCGKRAVPYLADYLLQGSPRTVSLPRCRAVHALGELGAWPVLLSYFRQYTPPADAQVLWAEDAVRSAAAQELMFHPSTEAFRVLLEAAWQRVTGGLVLAIAKYQRPESVPLLFHVLEDDVCRQDAMEGLRKMPDAVRQFGILSVRGLTDVTLEGPSGTYRRRAVLQLMGEADVARKDWLDLRKFLASDDASTVLAAARIGIKVAHESEHPRILEKVLAAAWRFNFVEEGEAEELLDSQPEIAKEIAAQVAAEKRAAGELPRWSSPFWRILHHVLGNVFEPRRNRYYPVAS